MHIAFLNPQGNFDVDDSYWSEHPDFGGQLVYVKEVAIALASRGHRIDILTRQILDPAWPEFAAPLDHYQGIPNLNIVRIPCGPKKFLPKERLWPYLGGEWVPNILNFYISTGSLPDMFAAQYGDGGLAAALLLRETGRPYSFTGHSLGAQKMEKIVSSPDNLVEIDRKYQFERRIQAERVSMRYASRVITSTRQERLEQYGHPAYRGAIDPADDSKFAVVPPGVNREVFSLQRTELDVVVKDMIKDARKRDIPKVRRKLPVVLMSSRLDPQKNMIGVVKAFACSQNLQEKANLAIAVRSLEDPLHDFDSLPTTEKVVMREIVSLIDKADLWDMVTAFPINSQSELAAAYRVLSKQRSVFSLTALYESFGLAPLEAMSCGLPVIVTKNGGPSESLVEGDREYGVLVDPADPENIANGILRVVRSEAKWRKLSETGIVRVKNKYTWDQTAEGYLAVFESLDQQVVPQNQVEIPLWFENPSAKNQDSLKFLSELNSI